MENFAASKACSLLAVPPVLGTWSARLRFALQRRDRAGTRTAPMGSPGWCVGTCSPRGEAELCLSPWAASPSPTHQAPCAAWLWCSEVAAVAASLTASDPPLQIPNTHSWQQPEPGTLQQLLLLTQKKFEKYSKHLSYSPHPLRQVERAYKPSCYHFVHILSISNEKMHNIIWYTHNIYLVYKTIIL